MRPIKEIVAELEQVESVLNSEEHYITQQKQLIYDIDGRLWNYAHILRDLRLEKLTGHPDIDMLERQYTKQREFRLAVHENIIKVEQFKYELWTKRAELRNELEARMNEEGEQCADNPTI